MMSPVHSIFVVLLFAAFAHAQYFPLVMDPYEMAERIQRMAQPHPQYASGGSYSSASSSSSSGSGGPVFFGGSGFNNGFGNAPFYANGPAYEQNYGSYENGGSLGIRFGSVPGGQGVHVSSSSHSNQPGSSGSFVSSSSATDGDGKIHYNVQSGRY